MNRHNVYSAQADKERDDRPTAPFVLVTENYLIGLDRLLVLLAEQPTIAGERRDIDPSVRLHRYKSHLVIFTASDTTLDVIRVVHARSNWQALLAD